MSSFKKISDEEDKNKPGVPSLGSQLPEKKIATIFPYLKFSGNGDAALNEVFKIEDDEPIIATSYITLAESGKEQKMEIICKKILPDCFLFYGFEKNLCEPMIFEINLFIEKFSHDEKIILKSFFTFF